MMKHYYTRTPTCAKGEKLINYNLNNTDLRFVQADFGSRFNKKVEPQINFFVKTLIGENISGKVLDVASGNGIVGIAISKFCNVNTMMSDINMYSLELAERNACLNKISVQNINTCESDAFSKIKETYDNILIKFFSKSQNDIALKTCKDAEKFLNSGGKMYTIIEKNSSLIQIMGDLKKVYGKCEIIDDNKGYAIIRCCKRKQRAHN